jgi:hypothetical protein
VLLSLLECNRGKTRKPVFLWIDASANFERLSSAPAIEEVMDKIAAASINGIIVDLKPISGEVLYPSKIAPHLLEWKGFMREKDFNYTGLMIAAAREREISVYAAMNVFSEGWKTQQRGIIYTTHPDWQTMLSTPEGLKPTTEWSQGYTAFVNPANRTVQDYEISLMTEILTQYDFDGIILDRARYDNIKSDFSLESLNQFQEFIQKKIEHGVADIYSWEQNTDGEWIRRSGKYYRQWLLWRATVIHDFFKHARAQVKALDPNLLFATYAGAWYPSYYELGVNWASRRYDPSQNYDWALPEYKNTGYAELLDFFMAGCYFYHLNAAELFAEVDRRKANNEPAMELEPQPYHTVEGSARLTMDLVQDATLVYGSLYVQQYKDRDDPDQFVQAVRMLIKETDGLMIFDLVHIEEFDWWPQLLRALESN